MRACTSLLPRPIAVKMAERRLVVSRRPIVASSFFFQSETRKERCLREPVHEFARIHRIGNSLCRIYSVSGLNYADRRLSGYLLSENISQIHAVLILRCVSGLCDF